MEFRKKILPQIVFMVLLLLAVPLYGQGPGGPSALLDGLAGGPPPPPGGGGGGGPINIPLDTNGLFLLIIAGMLYWFYYKYKELKNDISDLAENIPQE